MHEEADIFNRIRRLLLGAEFKEFTKTKRQRDSRRSLDKKLENARSDIEMRRNQLKDDVEVKLEEDVEYRLRKGIDRKTGLPLVGKGLRSLVSLYRMFPPPSVEQKDFTSRWVSREFVSLRGSTMRVQLAHILHPFQPAFSRVIIFPDSRDSALRAGLWLASSFVRAGVPITVHLPTPNAITAWKEEVGQTGADMNLQQLTVGLRQSFPVSEAWGKLKDLGATYKLSSGGSKKTASRIHIHMWTDPPKDKSIRSISFIANNWTAPAPFDSDVQFFKYDKRHNPTVNVARHGVRYKKPQSPTIGKRWHGNFKCTIPCG